MEAPKPISPKEFEKQEDFQIKSNKNKLFNLTIKYNSNLLIIFSIFKDNINIEEYEEIFTMEKIGKIKYFLLFNSLNEIYDEIIYLIKWKQNEIKLNEDGNIINLILPLEGLKFKQIEISLEKKIKSEKECIKDLYTIISDLKKENNALKVNQENLEKRNKRIRKWCKIF